MRALVWGNVVIAGSAAGWAIVSLRALSAPLDLVLIGLAFVLAIAFYTRDRLDAKEQSVDLETMPERTRWVQRHAPALRDLTWIGAMAAIGLAAMRPASLPPLLAGLGFALAYTVRWLPWRGRRLGWKHLPGMKMPFVAVLWTVVCVIAPAAVYDRLARSETWLAAGGVCALIMAQILINDLRDVAGDRTGGTASLPVLLGETAARRVGYGLAVIGALLPAKITPLPFLLTGLYSALLLRLYRRERDAFWRIWIEGQGLVAGLAALI